MQLASLKHYPERNRSRQMLLACLKYYLEQNMSYQMQSASLDSRTISRTDSIFSDCISEPGSTFSVYSKTLLKTFTWDDDIFCNCCALRVCLELSNLINLFKSSSTFSAIYVTVGEEFMPVSSDGDGDEVRRIEELDNI